MFHQSGPARPKGRVRAEWRGIWLLRSAWSRPGRIVTTAPACHGGLARSCGAGPVASVSSHDAGVGPDRPRPQPVRLTRTLASPAAALIVSTRPLASPDSILCVVRNRVIGRTDRGSALNGRCAECRVTRSICRCLQHYTAPVRTLHKGRLYIRSERGGKREILTVTQLRC